MPMELGWKLGELPMRIFGDFAVISRGDARAKGALIPTKAISAMLTRSAPASVIESKEDWQLEAFWQTQRAILARSNLVDSEYLRRPRQYGRRGPRAPATMLSDAVSVKSDLQLWLAQ